MTVNFEEMRADLTDWAESKIYEDRRTCERDFDGWTLTGWGQDELDYARDYIDELVKVAKIAEDTEEFYDLAYDIETESFIADEILERSEEWLTD